MGSADLSWKCAVSQGWSQGEFRGSDPIAFLAQRRQREERATLGILAPPLFPH